MFESKYPTDLMNEQITTFGAAKQQMETTIGFLSNYREQFSEALFDETIANLNKALEVWTRQNLPTKEKWRTHGK